MKKTSFLRNSALTLALAATVSAPALAQTPPNALVMAWNIDAISTFDPAQIAEVVTDEIYRNACESLVDFDVADESNYVPALAESWETSEDGLTMTFHLREGLTFRDGSPATAGDLAWSMQRVVRLGFGNAATLIEYGFTAANIEQTITAPDDRTLVLTLDRPYPASLILGSIAANRVASLLDRKVVEANATGDDLGNAYLATRTECVGPYNLVRWNPGEVVMLQANETAGGSRTPGLDQILIRHVAETGSQRLLIERGDVDVARNLNAEDLADLEQNENIKIETVLKPSMFYLAMNMDHPALNDSRVRLAMRYLIDYQGLGETVMRGVGVPRASYVQYPAVGALDLEEGQPFSLDLDKARELLTEAGYPDGFTATLLIGSHPYGSPIGQALQETAAQVGITLNMERMSNSQLFSRTRGREFETALLGFGASIPDAHMMSSRMVFNPDNAAEANLGQYPSWRSAYFDEDANARVEEAMMERDPARRIELYHALQRDQMENGPLAFIMQTMDPAALRTTITAYPRNGFRVYYDAVTK
ncbi:ABC transporter substrate-binding protein [Ketogulonicigenium vulgare]|uniref:ABC transporter substrate-binding protein n=1 Tax=Ketogulonicigenium vulgare TaxID=92945 RepID=UPI002359D139|nr:ABC transporter substrate-binding protein [Ketogulonicigenium vulgare]